MSALTSPPSPQRTIVLRCNSLGEKYVEGTLASGKTITPGMLVEFTTATPYPYPTVQPHSTAGGYARPLFAKEFGLAADIPYQSFFGGTIDDNYAAGTVTLVRIHEASLGDQIYALVAKSATAIVMTDFLTSAGDGTVKKATSSDQRLFAPLEAVDNSANSASTARIRIEVL